MGGGEVGWGDGGWRGIIVCRLTRLRAPSPAPLSSPVYDDCFRRDGEEQSAMAILGMNVSLYILNITLVFTFVIPED